MTRAIPLHLAPALLLGVVLVGQTFAQTDTLLTLSDCLRLAVQHSYAAQAENRRWQAQSATYQATRFQYLPQVRGEFTRNELQYRPYRFPQQFQLLSVEWTPGNWLYRAARGEALRVSAQKLILQQKRLEAARRAGALYLAILQKDTRLAVLSERKQILQRHLQIATALWQAGTTTQLDVLQTQSALKQLEEEILRCQSERDGLTLELRERLGWPAGRPLGFRKPGTPPDSLPPPPHFPPDSLATNPLLHSFRLAAQAEQAAASKAKAEAAPKLVLTGGYVVDRDPTADGNYWLISAGFQIPLTKWRQVQLQTRAATARATAVRLDERALGRELKIQAQRIRTELQKLWQAYLLQRERLSLARQTYEFAEANYQAGLVTNLDYLRAQEHLSEVEISLQSTRLEYLSRLLDYFAIFNRRDLMFKLDQDL